MEVRSMDPEMIHVIQLIHRHLVVDPVLIAEEVGVISVTDGCVPTVANYVHMSTCLYVSLCHL